MRCSNGMRRRSSPFFNCKRQWRPVVQSMWLRKPGEKRRPKPRKRLKNGGLQRRSVVATIRYNVQ